MPAAKQEPALQATCTYPEQRRAWRRPGSTAKWRVCGCTASGCTAGNNWVKQEHACLRRAQRCEGQAAHCIVPNHVLFCLRGAWLFAYILGIAGRQPERAFAVVQAQLGIAPPADHEASAGVLGQPQDACMGERHSREMLSMQHTPHAAPHSQAAC